MRTHGLDHGRRQIQQLRRGPVVLMAGVCALAWVLYALPSSVLRNLVRGLIPG